MVAIKSKVTATAVGVVHEVLVLVFVVDVDAVVVTVVVPVPVVVAVVVADPDTLVKVVGHAVLVAELKVPMAEVELQVAGTLLAEVSPHPAGTTELRRKFAVNKAA